MSTESPSENQPPARAPAKPASQEMLLDLNFVPTWAKAGTGKNPYEDVEYAPQRRDSRDRRGGGRRDDRRKPRGDGRAPRGDGQGQRDRSRSAPGDRRGPRRDGRGQGAPRGGRREGQRGPDRRDGGRRDDRRRDDRQPRREPGLPVDIRFMPDRNMLGAAVREMHSSLKAYPIMELASLFIHKPDHYLIKLQAPKAREGARPISFYQCRSCRAVFTDEAACEQHVINRHLDDYFDVEVVEGEPPRGNFLVVGRCRRTGTLLGPPNHHAYNRKLQEMVTTRFPGMSLDDYRGQIDMVRDPEIIEQWKNESRQQKQFRLKPPPTAAKKADAEVEEPAKAPPPPDPLPGKTEAGIAPAEPALTPDEAPAEKTPVEEASEEQSPPEAPPPEAPKGEALSEDDARRRFREEYLPKMILHGNRAVVPAEVAQSMEDGPVKRAIREAWFKESRFPLSMSLAMRPAFRHMRLHLFKTNRKYVFVTAVKPRPLDPGIAIDSIRDELSYLHDHPGCSRQELVEGLRPDAALESPEVAEVVSNLRWLIEKGHVIEFYDGRLSVPSQKAGSVEAAPPPKSNRGSGRPKAPSPAPASQGTETHDKPIAPPPEPAPEATPDGA